MHKSFENLGFSPADILLPKSADMVKWAVVACDQFTSQPEYWDAVEQLVGDAPSTLRMILPESKLNDPNVADHIEAINKHMADYMSQDVFTTLENSLIYIERTQSDGKIRHGLVGMVDLDEYDYTPGSGALIRATEGTVLDRIPPRVKVRQDAPVELPHVMILIDDPKATVIEPLTADTASMAKVYDFSLQQGGGHIVGYALSAAQIESVGASLAALATPEAMAEKYGMTDVKPLLFAVGDGNHSLATAKTCWENLKKTLSPEELENHPARFALAELVNNHDDALGFEPIHRVVFDVDAEALLQAFKAYYPGTYDGKGDGHVIAYTHAGATGYLTVPNPAVQLAVGTLQNFLDAYIKEHGGEVDYIHGDAVTDTLGAKAGNIGFRVPGMGKEQLFKTVLADGVLPRKTFSMGHAEDKRYYIESRKIR
ncbi:DUF1015 domain-containing protein [Bengtsoniella intestinalis]|uniref:DUF1015 domain-containing protein n=1 Tax=Bengtsoniella intestinalis TaxID=3073143 RepID=UPI00391FA035